MVIIVMGVAGSGKTTVGKLLAKSLSVDFLDADDFHSPQAIKKMRSGIALNSDDRAPWLERIASRITQIDSAGQSAVFACSALKESYRCQLRAAAKPEQLKFVYLRVSPEVVSERLRRRSDHFMPAKLATSQFEALEAPTDAICVDADQVPVRIVRMIQEKLAAA